MRTPYLPAEPLSDEDWVADDPTLRAFLAARLPARQWKDLEPRLARLGRVAPREVDPLARLADARPPVLDDDGALAFHPSYGELQRLAREHRVFTDAWHGGSRLTSLALGYVFAQAECGYFCPACMTDGAAFVLSRRSGFEDVARRLVQDEPEGALEGAMFLTERAGGSDVGATGTLAEGGEGAWRLTGDKWFCSNANAGAILTLARMPGAAEGTRGLGLFLVEQPNPGLRFTRLKEKLGVRSMATAEGELRDAPARLVAGEGQGFKAMAEMVNLSRLYNAVASVAIARRALREGQKNGAWRVSFGKKLQDHPLYARAVAALAVETKGALLYVLDAADAFERDPPLARALTPGAKAMTAKLAVRAASEACEMLGGNGYVQPWVTERLLRDAQVLPIWEGTTNIQALDFLRACAKERAVETLARAAPDAPDAWRAWAESAAAMDEMSSLRHMAQAYHLRAAGLLRRHDPLAGEAYALLHLAQDEPAFDRLVASEGAALAGWPKGP